MQNNYKFTYIIGYRYKADRYFNLLRVLDWLYPFQGVEIIIVEQDTQPRLQYKDLKCKYFFTKSDLPYNRSWAFNVGLKEATTNSVVFGDSDMVMEPQLLINSIIDLQSYEAVKPFDKFIDLTKDEVNLPLGQLLNIIRPGRGELDHQKTNFCSGQFAARKDSMIKIGGFPEEFVGWGGEDNLVSDKISRFLKSKQNIGRCYHLWHHQDPPDYKFYSKNLQILNELVALNNQQMSMYIQSTIPLIGSKARFENAV